MNDNVCILIPTLNEGKTIGASWRASETGLRGYPRHRRHSADNTVSEAKAAGARVVIQHGRGKGTAVQQAFNHHR